MSVIEMEVESLQMQMQFAEWKVEGVVGRDPPGFGCQEE